jgi:hypothetical protein
MVDNYREPVKNTALDDCLFCSARGRLVPTRPGGVETLFNFSQPNPLAPPRRTENSITRLELPVKANLFVI